MVFAFDPDVIRDRLRTDISLRNLSIYAQWISVTAAALLYLPTFYALYRYLVILDSDEVHGFMSLLDLTLDLGPLNLLFPLVILGLELPHYIRRQPLLCWSTATCLTMPPRYFYQLWILETTDPFNTPTKITVASFFVFFLCLPTLLTTFVTLGSFGGSKFTMPDMLAGRILINLVYFVQLSLPTVSYSFYRFRVEGGWINGFMSLLFWFSACLFGVAALLYIAASIKRHLYVSSTLLGGNGIEPMTLWLPGTGPSHQSIGNEAQEGAIRLV
ncbi:unnamed protein product [Alternaria burnsii]|nr:unnamed protein product [Alternaria burnsii]